jgi:hypothetical protein
MQPINTAYDDELTRAEDRTRIAAEMEVRERNARCWIILNPRQNISDQKLSELEATEEAGRAQMMHQISVVIDTPLSGAAVGRVTS